MPQMVGIKVVMVRPKEWKGGRKEYKTSSAAILAQTNTPLILFRRFLLLKGTPLGTFSEPLVKRMTATSSSFLSSMPKHLRSFSAL